MDLSCLKLFLSLLLVILLLKHVRGVDICPQKCTCSDNPLTITCTSLTKVDWLQLIKNKSFKSARKLVIISSTIGLNLDLSELLNTTTELIELQITQCGLQDLTFSSDSTWKSIETIDLSHNQLNQVTVNELIKRSPRLKNLKLRGNLIETLSYANYSSYQQPENVLYSIDLQDNKIKSYRDDLKLPNGLLELNLAGNPIEHFEMLEAGTSGKLKILNLSRSYFSELSPLTFLINSTYLKNVRQIDLSDSKNLTKISVDVSLKLANLTDHTTINLNGCAKLSEWAWVPKLGHTSNIDISNTNNWNCTCHNLWIGKGEKIMGKPKCNTPSNFKGATVQSVNSTQLGCGRPKLVLFASKARYGVGDTARLLCDLKADPEAHTIWTTNTGYNLTLNPGSRSKHLTSADTQTNIFHSKHDWHWNSGYFDTEEESHNEKRIFILQDGSLYIDYVTIADAGLFTCSGINSFGSVTGEISFTLKNNAMRAVRNHSFIVAGICTGALLTLGFIIGLIKLIARKCSEEERKKKKSIREMLEHLESYRGAKMEQFREYKDWFRNLGSSHIDTYNARMVKVKDGCSTNMSQMHESYNRRIAKIKEQCDLQILKVRESYQSQMSKIKDYRSHQVDRVRDNYNQQLFKIKEYASSQLEKLREQYKAQQTVLMKMMGSMHIDNCMTSDNDGEDELNFKLDLSADELSDNGCDNMDLLALPLNNDERRPSSNFDDDEDFMTATDLAQSTANLADFDDNVEIKEHTYGKKDSNKSISTIQVNVTVENCGIKRSASVDVVPNGQAVTDDGHRNKRTSSVALETVPGNFPNADVKDGSSSANC